MENPFCISTYAFSIKVSGRIINLAFAIKNLLNYTSTFSLGSGVLTRRKRHPHLGYHYLYRLGRLRSRSRSGNRHWRSGLSRSLRSRGRRNRAYVRNSFSRFSAYLHRSMLDFRRSLPGAALKRACLRRAYIRGRRLRRIRSSDGAGSLLHGDFRLSVPRNRRNARRGSGGLRLGLLGLVFSGASA